MTPVLLACIVAGARLAALGLLRLKTPADRLHLIAFVNIATGLPLALLAITQDGPTPRTCKIIAIVLLNLLCGAAGAHVIGRALLQRGER